MPGSAGLPPFILGDYMIKNKKLIFYTVGSDDVPCTELQDYVHDMINRNLSVCATLQEAKEDAISLVGEHSERCVIYENVATPIYITHTAPAKISFTKL